jgi:hypothetical protein
VAGDLTNHYEKFQPPERLTLLIEAMARDDRHEAERLQRTCPRKTYTQQDAEFEGRWDMAFDILAVVSIDMRCAWGKLHVLEWVIGNVKDISTGHHVTASLAFRGLCINPLFRRLSRMRAALIRSLAVTQARTRQIRRTHGGREARPPPKQTRPEKSRSAPVRRSYRSGPNGFTAAGASGMSTARRRCGET